jgi:hypothetical protein
VFGLHDSAADLPHPGDVRAAAVKPMEGPCEVGTGVDPDAIGIRLLKCHQPGVERFDVPAVVGHPIMCDEHYEEWKERHRGPVAG